MKFLGIVETDDGRPHAEIRWDDGSVVMLDEDVLLHPFVCYKNQALATTVQDEALAALRARKGGGA